MADETLAAMRRRWVLEIKLGADTYEDLTASLVELANDLDRRPPAPINIVSGSPSAGYIATGDEEPTVTHESYFEAVERWKAGRR